MVTCTVAVIRRAFCWVFSWVFTNWFTTWPHKSFFWRSMGGETILHRFTQLLFKTVIFWYSRSICRLPLPCSYCFLSYWCSWDPKFRELRQLQRSEKRLTFWTGSARSASAGEGSRQKCMVRDREKAPYSHCWVCLATPSILHLPAHNWGQIFAWFLSPNFRLLWKVDYKNKVEFKCLMERRNRWPRNHLLALYLVYFSFKVFSFTSVLLLVLCMNRVKCWCIYYKLYYAVRKTSTSQCYQYDSTASECSFHLHYQLYNFVVFLVYFLWVPQSSKCIQVSKVHLTNN